MVDVFIFCVTSCYAVTVNKYNIVGFRAYICSMSAYDKSTNSVSVGRCTLISLQLGLVIYYIITICLQLVVTSTTIQYRICC